MARQTRGRRTDYNWFNFGDRTQVDIGVGGMFQVAALGFLQAQTITRIRGRIGAVLDATAIDESAMVLAGLMIINTDAFVGGSAAEVFTGGADDASWIWQGALWVSSGAEAAVVSDGLFDRVEVDTKAMRRVKAGQTLALVLDAPGALALDQGGTIDVTAYFHVLTGA